MPVTQVLKAEKQNADEKLEKLHAVLEKEREALRDVLASGNCQSCRNNLRSYEFDKRTTETHHQFHAFLSVQLD